MGGGPVGLTPGVSLDADSDERAWKHLEEHIRWLWPHLETVRISHRWGGPFSVTLDLTPALGSVGDPGRVVYAVGCIGHGVSMSYRNGRVLASLLLDRDRDLVDSCPFVNRRLVPWPAEPLATAAKYSLREYLRAEDAFNERVLTRELPGLSR